MTIMKALIKDKILLTGWILVLFSFATFCVPLITNTSSESYFGFFMVHFSISVFYFFFIFFQRRETDQAQHIHYDAVRLVLFLISAYALNRSFTVFAASPNWFSILLVVVSLNYLLSVFFESMKIWIRYLVFFLYGVSIVLFVYLTIYLFPLYALSLFGMIALGISVHSFIPGLIVFYTIRLANRLANGWQRYWLMFGAGVGVSVFICIGFIISWSNHVNNINRQYSAIVVDGDDQLPIWVQLAQKLSNDGINEKILKSNLIYAVPSWDDGILWNMPQRNFGEEQQLHDPLVMLGSFFSRKVNMSEADRIKILESQYNKRHQALERLWTGVHLKTTQVSTQIRIWPQLHLAYTEKFITVFNYQTTSAWPLSEEGIYTFHMPEGAVVTSLSLWINGKEEKGILTTKQKAATAYNSVVGVERRDPSVIHWQEGNTVSVRVFPVNAQSSRIFKLGITAPLRKEGSELVYDNTWFEGPDAGAAEETTKLEMVSEPKTFVKQASFVSENNRVFTNTGNYKPRWSLQFKDPGLKQNSFSFNGNSYSIKPYLKQRVPTNITDVFLDISQAWQDEEINAILNVVKNKKVWVYDGNLIELTDDNRSELLTRLKKNEFSLFPFHLVTDRTHSLVISKTGDYTPDIADLEGSGFLNSIRSTASLEKIKLFNLGAEISPYHRSLKELRFFDFEFGDRDLLQELVAKNVFAKDTETENQVVVHSADVVIEKEAVERPSSAPDHLMRLFAYNHIMQQLGGKDLTKADENPLLAEEAREAYVVSPVSSLIVLETQNDYDRFGIEDSENSLKNASLKNKGAVPEPAEWAIIIAALAIFIFFMLKWKIL